MHVLDLNDNAPRFVLDMYQKVISENVSVDSAILRVTATDPDSGTNGQVHYAIEGGNTNNTFDLDNQGVLRLQQSLKTQDTNLFNLTIRARDHGLPPKVSSPVSVYVSVKRSALPCKQKLAFQQGVYLANVNESTPVNTNILRVQAKMGDCGFKGRITYFLSDFKDPEIDNYFVINAKTGVIRLIRPLDFEVRDRYTFSVAAVGKHLPSMYCSLQLHCVALKHTYLHSLTGNKSYYDEFIHLRKPRLVFFLSGIPKLRSRSEGQCISLCFELLRLRRSFGSLIFAE